MGMGIRARSDAQRTLVADGLAGRRQPALCRLGQWTTTGGVRRWRSNWTWRPLARRDAVRDPVYDRYLAINRHQPTPDGWIHWQDNIKMETVEGEQRPVVQEYVLNTYSKFSDYQVQAADDYWIATEGYWAAVRVKWDRVASEKGGIRLKEEAATGTVISGRLLEMGTATHRRKTWLPSGHL